jgi:DNA-directed RNA polymerase III subunit RPC7
VAEFFPEELYTALGIDPNSVSSTGSSKQKTLLISALDTLNPLDGPLGGDDDDEGDEKEKKAVEEEETGGAEEDEDEDPDHFSDDEDDDYNAEKYFESADDMEDYGDDDAGEAGDYF